MRKSAGISPFIWIPLALVGLAFFFSLFFGQFVASGVAVHIGYAASLVCAIAGGFRFYRATVGRTRRAMEYRPLRAALGAFFCGFLGFLAFAHSISMIFTLMFGTPSVRIVTVSGWHSGSRSCSGPYLAEASTLAAHLCYNNRVPPGTRLELRGPQTILGMAVGYITVIESDAP